ncbi:DUF3618 domain-containing protein [Streptomyces sp. YKOK-I1]
MSEGEGAPMADSGPVGGTVARLWRGMARTGGRLGGAMGELAGRADVGGRVWVRTADLRDRAGARAWQLRGAAFRAGHALREHAARAARGEVARAGPALERRASASAPAPAPMRCAMRHAKPVAIAGAAGAALLAAAVLARRRPER